MKIKKDPNLKPCPFCGGKVKQAEGIGGLLFFSCMNYGECGAIISFDNIKCNRFPKTAVMKYNKRADEGEKN